MGWSALIMMLIQVLGPILIEWLRKWLDNRMQLAAEQLPAFESYPTEHDAREALFAKAVADLPRRAFARRALLRRLQSTAAACGVTSAGAIRPPSEAEYAELADLAGAAAEE